VFSVKWSEDLARTQGGTPALAASLFYLDQAIVYTEREHRAIQAEIQAGAIDNDDDDGDNGDDDDDDEPAVCLRQHSFTLDVCMHVHDGRIDSFIHHD
jgi:hypothetical protein